MSDVGSMRENVTGVSEKSLLSDEDVASWKKKFFDAIRSVTDVKAVFFHIQARHVTKNKIVYSLIPSIGWKVQLPEYCSDSPDEMSALRQELTATLRLSDVQVIHRNAEWLKYLRLHHEVGMSYAKLCGIV